MSTQIPVTYQNLKTKLLAELNNTSHVSLTTDIWTSLQTTSYCCVIVHYITDTLQSFSLKCQINNKTTRSTETQSNRNRTRRLNFGCSGSRRFIQNGRILAVISWSKNAFVTVLAHKEGSVSCSMLKKRVVSF